MIEIYLKTNTNFDKNGDITLDPISCTYKDSDKGVILEHYQDEDGRWKYIDFENVIAAIENGKKKLYRIYNVIRSLDSVTAYARPIFYDLLDKVLIDVRPTNKTGQEALNIILDGTGFIGHSNISSLNTSYYVRKNIVEALISDDENSFLNRWGGEFYCENFDVYINDKIGSDNGVRVEFGYNLNEIEEDVNIEEVATRIIPVGYNGITLSGKEPWVDSPLANKYTKPKMRVIEFSDIKVKESDEDEDGFETIEEAREELIKRCNMLFEEGIDKPLVNYKIDMINLANTIEYKDFKVLVEVNKGDTVTCYINHLGIAVKARVIDYERDLITGDYTFIELGNVVKDFFNNQSDIQATVNKITNQDGTVNAVEVAGILNAVNVKMRAMKDIAQKQDVRALLCEDLDPDSPTYGAMCYGTMGFMIASERTEDNRDWNWRTFGTGKGFFADLIVAGTMLADRIKGGTLESLDGSCVINLSNGEINISKGRVIGKNMMLNLDTGEIISSYRSLVEGKDYDVIIKNGEMYSENYLKVNSKKGATFGYKAFDGTYTVENYFAGYDWGCAISGTAERDKKLNIIMKQTNVSGDFAVSGTKNCIQDTDHYGKRLYYATEDCESLLTDTGKSVTKSTKLGNYEAVVLIDNIYKESVILDDYYIFLSKYGKGDIWIKEQTENYFIIESDNPIKFDWKVEATRRGYANVRLDEYKEVLELEY